MAHVRIVRLGGIARPLLAALRLILVNQREYLLPQLLGSQEVQRPVVGVALGVVICTLINIPSRRRRPPPHQLIQQLEVKSDLRVLLGYLFCELEQFTSGYY